jgi:hypothetical protein
MKLLRFIRYEFENAVIVADVLCKASIKLLLSVFSTTVRFITAPLVTLFLVYFVLLLVVLFL